MPHEDVTISNVDVHSLHEGVCSIVDRQQLADLEGILDRQVAGLSFPACFSVTAVPLIDETKGGGAVDPRLLAPPLHYNQAHRRADTHEWTVAEEREMAGLRVKNVFSWKRVEDIPPGTKVLTTRYVYDFKTNERNESIKYKARLVVWGF